MADGASSPSLRTVADKMKEALVVGRLSVTDSAATTKSASVCGRSICSGCSSATTAARSSIRCAALIGVFPADGAASGQDGASRPAAAYAAARADLNSARCTSLTRVTPAVRTGSVHAKRPTPAVTRTPSIRDRSSVKWTALIGVTPAWSGSSVKAVVTVAANECVAIRPAGSAAVT